MADHIDVQIEARENGRMRVSYLLICDAYSLMLPEVDEPTRSDGLWQTTCFELFVRRPDGEAYFEYNFSPSTEWQVYRFSGYRSGMAEEMLRCPKITCDFSETHFALNVELVLPDCWHQGSYMLGLSSVIEEVDGSKSYWALAHPPGKPDFHHKDCFALQLEAPRAA